MNSNASPILVAEGFNFPEGPSFDREGSLYVMECDAGRISKLTLDGHVEVFAETGGVPCGSRLHQNGQLIVAENGLAQILDFAPDGSWTVVAGGRLTRSRFAALMISFSIGTATATSPIPRAQHWKSRWDAYSVWGLTA